MHSDSYEFLGDKILIRARNRLCETPEELLGSDVFRAVLCRGVEDLARRGSYLLGIFNDPRAPEAEIDTLVQALLFLTKMRGDLLPNVLPDAAVFMRKPALFNEFVEYLYNFWRSFNRFVICDSNGDDFDKRPYRTFNSTIENLTHLVRSVYRDIEENIVGARPRIYRQVHAGAEFSVISIDRETPFSAERYRRLNGISLIRHVLLCPPLILNPTMNRRAGEFIRLDENPIDRVEIDPKDWLCYPAKVGSLLIYVYFHKTFSELGFSLCNLFKLADDEDLGAQPDAVYLFGAPGDSLDRMAEFPTVFHEDGEGGMLVAAVPARPEFGYFGYLKKMVLTLHNVKAMRRGHLPFHGAFVKIMLKGGGRHNVLIIGDTGAGKSETLEALRDLARERISDLVIIADDMGSLELGDDGRVLGYGTETGAFLRLDDLKPGYAFGQIDRAIIMSANRINARIVLPVTTYENMMRGEAPDVVLYANNYEEVDDGRPIIERFAGLEEAIGVFREGAVMSKGTTASTGLAHSYFANIFGPPQYRELHEPLARRYFEAFFASGVFVGQMRTRIGLEGRERSGAEEAAKGLLELLEKIG